MIGIRVVSRAGIPLDRLSLGVPALARFGDVVGDIGRGTDCTLVLPDPERTISRRQVLITCRSGRHYICPIGSHAVIELDGQPLAADVETPLGTGSEIRIGPYLLQVEDVPEETAPAAGTVQSSTPAPAAAEDPLALIGKDRTAAASVFSDLLDAKAGAKTAAPPVPARARPAMQRPPDTIKSTLPIDFDIGESTQPVTARAERERPARAPAGRTAPAGDDAGSNLFAALGVPMPHDPATRAQQAKLVGELLRAAVAGLLELLAARTIAKREIGADPTELKARENNPLKFSPDADAALAHLLGPPQPGFTRPLEAMQAAFGDLHAHELAMLTGMRAALDEVLARFDPKALAPRLAPAALWNKLLPTARKAKLWELYSQQYADILREIEGDFDTLFNRAFLRAYQAQLAELARVPPRGE
jgi:type VI secretion system FHA domain protein